MESNISFLKAERNFSAFVKRKVIHGINLISYAILGNLTTLSYYCNTVQFAQHYFKLAHFYEFVYKKLYVIGMYENVQILWSCFAFPYCKQTLWLKVYLTLK